ncbi:acyl-CoA dehydrogenase family protein [Myxococcota bacterium]|nr:acyl-CoA dehydrogenase family protein [Myxococcota bacterium]
MIEFDPTEEQELVVETVRQFVENEVRPAARECDEACEVPRGLLDQAHELGLVANALPESVGGGGERNAVTQCLIAEELAWGDLAIALSIMSPSLTALPVADFGTEEQQQRVLPRFAGPNFTPGSIALVEPRFDSDPFRPKSTAKREGDEYVIDGAKCLVPWLDGDEQVLVFASEEGRAQGFLVDRNSEGLTAEAEQNLGVQALGSVELTLSGVRVSASDKLGGDAGVNMPALVARGRVGLAAMGVGVARAAYDLAREYAKEREAFGAKIASKQAIAFMLADMAIEIDAARLLTWEAAWGLDAGRDALRESTLAYQQVQRVALQVADGAVQVMGGHGYIRDYLPEMHLRNARGFAMFEALTLV